MQKPETPAPAVVLPDEYHAVSRERELIGKIKSEISAASKAIGGVVAPAGTPQRPDAHEHLSTSLTELQVLVEEYKEKRTTTDSSVVFEVVTEALQLCAIIPESKEHYGEFVLSIHGLTRQLFSEQSRLLQLMKDIKKSAAVLN